MNQVCIHQPDFAPFMGFFQRLLDSDVFIILDDAQFQRSGWMHRDKIKTPQGASWLTVPVNKKCFLAPINDVEFGINSEQWISKNLNLIKQNYQLAPFFDDYYPTIEKIYTSGENRLAPFNYKFVQLFIDLFEIEIDIKFSSQMNKPGKSNARLVDLIKAVNGNRYVTGTGSSEYLDQDLFAAAGIEVEIRSFRSSSYPQLHGAFIENLSSLDVMFNCGPKAAEVLRKCNA